MQKTKLFEQFGEEFDESIRVDRELDPEERLELLEDYHVTDEAYEFLEDLLKRLLGEDEGMRRGWNHWLYGYFGSGKSHLLAVTGHLLDTDWLQEVGRDTAWEALAGERKLTALRDLWTRCLDEFRLEPLFINLLKHQGRTHRGFGEVILESMYDRMGLSSRLSVALFEDWYRGREAWESRASKAEAILDEAGIDPGEHPWSKVRRYEIASNLVLPALFEEETSTADGLSDLVDRSLDQQSVVERLQKRRKELEAEHDRPVKLVVLLDEISLFIGTDHNLLTELNALAEQIDKVAGGDILSVVTAQEKISDTRIDYVGHGVSFSILNDRFPHQYQLPVGHVGKIVQKRLLEKSGPGRGWLEERVDELAMPPTETFGFKDVEQDTSPSLEDVDADEFYDYFPLLPYHPPLFLEILSSIRDRGTGRAKSVFAGTARAVLALVKGLLEEWAESSDRKPTEAINLVDFFEIIRPELDNIIPRKVASIEAIERERDGGELNAFDVDVAKVVLLLDYVDEFTPLTDFNIATALLRDLSEDEISTKNAVADSLDRLDKYIRPVGAGENGDNGHRGYRFTTPEEQQIIDAARSPDSIDDWSAFCETIERELWDDVVEDLDLDPELPYRGSSDDEESEEFYSTKYKFALDEFPFRRPFPASGELEIFIRVVGLLPEDVSLPSDRTDELEDWEDVRPLEWRLPDDNLRAEVRREIREWASLENAVDTDQPPESIERDLKDKKTELRRDLQQLFREGSFEIQAEEPANRDEALRQTIQRNYPDHFHPEMDEVGAADLLQLKRRESGDSLPDWARKIDVPKSTQEDPTEGDIRIKVRQFAGKALREHEELSISRLLELILEQEPRYKSAKPALAAILWGLCWLDTSKFWPADNVHVDQILNPNNWSDVRIRLGEGKKDLRERLEALEFVDATDSTNDALVKFENQLKGLRQQLRGTESEVQTFADNTRNSALRSTVDTFLAEIRAWREKLEAFENQLASADPDWFDIIEGFESVLGWHESAVDIWETRQSFLLELDVVLLVGAAELPWVGDEVKSRTEQLAGELQGLSDANWWEDKASWKDFAGELSTKFELEQELAESWQAYRDSEGRAALFRRCEGHSWIRPAYDFPSHVRPTFRQMFVDPVHSFVEDYRDAQKIMDPFVSTSPDMSVWRSAVSALDNNGDFPGLSPEAVESAERKLEMLDELAGDSEPEEVRTAAVWPSDEKLIRSYANNAVRTDGKQEATRHKHGLVIRQGGNSS